MFPAGWKQEVDVPVNLSDYSRRRVTSGSHQYLKQDHEQLVTGHEVTVEDSQVEPAAQTAKHLDEHLLIVTRLLHT